LLTEAEVQRSYRRLLKNQQLSEDILDRAAELVEELRPESPLRHRLIGELEELRQLWGSRPSA
jgi:hypothetical protein